MNYEKICQGVINLFRIANYCFFIEDITLFELRNELRRNYFSDCKVLIIYNSCLRSISFLITKDFITSTQKYKNQNPRQCVFFNSLVYMWVCGFVGLYETSWPNEKRCRPEIWYTHSPKPYLKTGFLFFTKKVSLRASSLE